MVFVTWKEKLDVWGPRTARREGSGVEEGEGKLLWGKDETEML